MAGDAYARRGRRAGSTYVATCQTETRRPTRSRTSGLTTDLPLAQPSGPPRCVIPSRWS